MKISHIAWNLGGLSVPLIVAAITVPTLVIRLGQERFGILALAWGLIGYASALDLGIGRALTQHIGKLLGTKQIELIPAATATAIKITFFAGLIGGSAIFLAGIFGAAGLIKSVDVSKEELTICILMLSLALPIQAMSATYKGINEAYLKFKEISILRTFLGAINFGGPFLISLYTKNLPLVVGSIVLSRVVAFFFYRKIAMKCLPKTKSDLYKYSSLAAHSLLGFGGWLTISSVISPMLVQADRFVIAGTISAAAVFIYVLPYEFVVQSLILVGAISSVIFPGLARLMHEKPEEWKKYFKKWLLRVAVLMLFVCSTIAATLPYILPLWIKSEISPESIAVGKILCIGVFSNSLGSMFYALLHAQGKTKVTAKLHLFEFPIFIFILLLMVKNFGVVGAASAWTGRMIFDSLVLGLLASQSELKPNQVSNFG